MLRKLNRNRAEKVSQEAAKAIFFEWTSCVVFTLLPTLGGPATADGTPCANRNPGPGISNLVGVHASTLRNPFGLSRAVHFVIWQCDDNQIWSFVRKIWLRPNKKNAFLNNDPLLYIWANITDGTKMPLTQFVFTQNVQSRCWSLLPGPPKTQKKVAFHGCLHRGISWPRPHKKPLTAVNQSHEEPVMSVMADGSKKRFPIYRQLLPQLGAPLLLRATGNQRDLCLDKGSCRTGTASVSVKSTMAIMAFFHP